MKNAYVSYVVTTPATEDVPEFTTNYNAYIAASDHTEALAKLGKFLKGQAYVVNNFSDANGEIIV